MNPTHSEPKLQPPGAGLPILQYLFVRLLVGPILSKLETPEQSRASYERLTSKLIEKISGIPSEKRKIRVLVKPLHGLEDSSRYWSLNGVLEHLLIVSKKMEAVILSLSSGQVPDEIADTAKVKPHQMERDFLPEFASFAPSLMQNLDSKLTQPGFYFNSTLKFKHPWFGPITAKQWYWLMNAHLQIHYRQVKEIIAGLN